MHFYSYFFYLMLMWMPFAVSAQQVPITQDIDQTLTLIEPDSIKAHITYLADDRLEGRLPGTKGYQLAVDYVISQLKSAGIAPGGEKGSYLQTVPFRKTSLNPEVFFQVQSTNTLQQLKSEQDFVLYPNASLQEVKVDAPLVFAGYGITAPEKAYDDYQSVPVKGKIVVVFRGLPSQFAPETDAHYSSIPVLIQNAIAHGAVGLMMVNPTAGRLRGPSMTNVVLDPNKKPAIPGTYATHQLKVLALISPNAFHQLLQQAMLDSAALFQKMRQGKIASVQLKAKASIRYQSSFLDYDGYNVIAKIPGNDPELKNEYVVHTAHLDHLGIGRPVEGDSIYNGAHDNASGVACLLEMAKTYKRTQPKLRRSVLVAFVTGEEMGLLGSAYMAKRPTVPIKNIIADINTDMPTIIAPLLSAVAIGAEHSSLQQQVVQATNHLGIALEADPEPEQNRFVRSDQYSFIKEGIPALHIKYGNKTASGSNDLNKMVVKWRAKYYHKPQDDIQGLFDFNAGKVYAQLNFLIGYLVVQDDMRPVWNPGDRYAPKKE